jgi:predicted nucleotidyltransferase component of viral defense system
MERMTFHDKALSPKQLKLLKVLGPFMTKHSCYLAGGTALAVLLGHRKSTDLDWFTSGSIKRPEIFVEMLQQFLKTKNLGMKDIEMARGTIYATIDGVKISIMEFRYPLLHKPIKWSNGNSQLASPDDIACMKLSAITSRGSKRDFIDIYALLEERMTLQEMLRAYRKKFSGHDFTHVLYGLSYFEDAERQKMPRMLWDVNWKKIRDRIIVAIQEITQ